MAEITFPKFPKSSIWGFCVLSRNSHTPYRRGGKETGEIFGGCHDVLGQLKDGRFLGCEVKSATGRLRPEQAVFLERIRGAGGVGFVARDCRDVFNNLK